MSAETAELWTRVRSMAGLYARLVIYPAILMLLYALTQGPVIYYHNKSIRAGGTGYARFISTAYAPVNRIRHMIPGYPAYLGWWLKPD